MKTKSQDNTQKSMRSWHKSRHVPSLCGYPFFIYAPNFGMFMYMFSTVGLLNANWLPVAKNKHKGTRSEIGQYKPRLNRLEVGQLIFLFLDIGRCRSGVFFLKNDVTVLYHMIVSSQVR